MKHFEVLEPGGASRSIEADCFTIRDGHLVLRDGLGAGASDLAVWAPGAWQTIRERPDNGGSVNG